GGGAGGGWLGGGGGLVPRRLGQLSGNRPRNWRWPGCAITHTMAELLVPVVPEERRMKHTAWFAVAALLAMVGLAPAELELPGGSELKAIDQWPHWRGPLATGESPHGDPPTKWDENTNIKWKPAVPGTRGSSTPIVWGDSVFVAAAIDTKRVAKAADVPKPNPNREYKTKPPNTYHQFLLVCYERQTGKIRWERVCTE